MARGVRLDGLDTIAVAGVNWRPVRRALGITGFGVNAYTADRDEQLIEEHDESGAGAGGHQELYVVLEGWAARDLDLDPIRSDPRYPG